jgi:hypothetical protein
MYIYKERARIDMLALEVLREVTVKDIGFWCVTTCNLVHIKVSFGGILLPSSGLNCMQAMNEMSFRLLSSGF